MGDFSAYKEWWLRGKVLVIMPQSIAPQRGSNTQSVICQAEQLFTFWHRICDLDWRLEAGEVNLAVDYFKVWMVLADPGYDVCRLGEGKDAEKELLFLK